MLLAVDALRAIGVARLTVDLNLPTLVAAVVSGLKLAAEPAARLRRALDRKDEAAIAKALGDDKKATDLFVGLLRAAGPAATAIAQLKKLKLPAAAAAEAARLAEVVALIGARRRGAAAHPRRRRLSRPRIPDRRLLLGVRAGRPQELARGGRYSAGYPEDGVSEPATGFTLYMDAVLAASQPVPDAPPPLPARRHAVARGRAWQAKGYAVVRAVARRRRPAPEAEAPGAAPTP